MPQKFNVASIVNNDGCFDLQFRKDTRHERTNSPTYYRWKTQFIVTCPKANKKILYKIQKELGCGQVNVSNSQARFSVQKIDDIITLVVPYFRKNLLAQDKKKDFELWSKAVNIIKENKGKYLTTWKKSDLNQLIEIQKSCGKYKRSSKSPKWIDMAKVISKSS